MSDKGKGIMEASPAEKGFSLPMSMKILSWNIRGLNMPLKQKVIKKLLIQHRISIVCVKLG